LIVVFLPLQQMGEGWGHLVLSRLLSAVVLLAIASSSSFSFAG